MFRYSIESKTSKMEIFNATSVYYTIIQIFILIFLGRGEGGINFSADCLGGSENLYGPWGGI